MHLLKVIAALDIVGLARAGTNFTVVLCVEGHLSDCEVEAHSTDPIYSCHEAGEFLVSYFTNFFRKMYM